MDRGLAVLVAIGVVAGGILERRSHENDVAKWTNEQAIPTVAVITPKTGPTQQSLVLPATIQAWYEASIYARVSGYLKDWYFDYGAHVKKGDVLAKSTLRSLMLNWPGAGQVELG